MTLCGTCGIQLFHMAVLITFLLETPGYTGCEISLHTVASIIAPCTQESIGIDAATLFSNTIV